MEETAAFILLKKVLDMVSESGVNETEARCAIKAAEALIPDLKLRKESSTVIQT